MKKLNSYNVQIWVGLKEGYGDIIHSLDEVKLLCQKYVDVKKQCVTVTATEFIYTEGNEPGAIIGFISYPRFPKEHKEIDERALELASILIKELGQKRVTVTTPEESIMLENENNNSDMVEEKVDLYIDNKYICPRCKQKTLQVMNAGSFCLNVLCKFALANG